MPDSRWLTAYIDESGNTGLEIATDGTSNLFVCAAVIVDESQKGPAIEAMQEVSRTRFGGTEVKGSRIGGSPRGHQRRLRVLGDVANIDFGYYALVVDKGRIRSDSGLKYKRSFYKFLNRMLYNRLLMTGANLLLVPDEHGGKDFMDSFEPYLEERGVPDLFTRWDHRFVESKSEPLVQLADLVANTLTYCFDPEKQSEFSPQFREMLREKEYGIDGWPRPEHVAAPIDITTLAGLNAALYASSVNKVLQFENEHYDSASEDLRMQVATLRRLMFLLEYEGVDGNRSIVKTGLIRNLFNRGFPELGEQAFSSRIIGRIREAGIIIAGGHDGYRLATTVRDINQYIEHDKNILLPMLRRLKIAREVARIDTAGHFDILAGEDSLKVVVDAFADAQIGGGTE